MAADGSVIIDTRMDTSGVQNGVSAIKKSFNGLGSAVKKIGLLIGGAFAVGRITEEQYNELMDVNKEEEPKAETN